jgi:pilus assembly protein CpaF
MFERYRKPSPGQDAPPPGAARTPPIPPAEPDLSANTSLKVALHQRLLESLNLVVLESMQRDEVAVQIAPLVREMLEKQRIALNAKEYATLLDEILDEFLGLGPLEPFLKDPSVSDILVNTHKQVFVERHGQLEKTTARFKDDDHLVRIIQKIVAGVGRRVDEAQPWVDARLPDGSRVNALLPPCAVDGPLLSIRKFAKIPYTMELLVANGTLTADMARLLEVVVRSRLNVLISGGTGTGKTTFLNALSSFIDNRERIVTIEDTAELQLQQEHVGRMETRPPNLEGKGEVTQRDLVRNALRMRPDRIIVGEVRGPEVIDMLQAMNTGHDGSMTTVHANTPRDALTRLEHMVSLAGLTIPPKDLRMQMSSALQLVIQIQRFMDGRRRIVSIQEIVGMEGDVVSMQEIYTFHRTGVDAHGNVLGRHEPTGIHPKLAARAAEYGLTLPENLAVPPSMDERS